MVEVGEDLAFFGAPQEVAEKLESEKGQSWFEVWEENEMAVRIFLGLTTQWVQAGMGGFVGLNYQSMDFLFKTYGVKKRQDVFEQIHIMEIAALAERNKKKG